jgi:hypothetical protein
MTVGLEIFIFIHLAPFTTNLFDSNVNAEIVRQAVRHSSITQLWGYEHLVERH